MEAPPASTSVSLHSQMNAFYGNPNLSQETTAAVFRGADAPEVYTAEAPPEPQEAGTSPVEDYFAQTTEQLEISEQATALLQQQGNETPVAQPSVGTNEGVTPAPEAQALFPENEVVTQLQVEEAPQNVPSEIGETRKPSPPIQTENSKPTAVSALNENPTPEPQTTSANDKQPENTPLQQSYGYAQLGSGPAAASNASQPGALFSALG
ncbi:MAG: hypothetical protein U9Q58_08345 [Pseudomonadota bacterium]|nr:hypothetical protein [Pseudomonadota bacterium]